MQLSRGRPLLETRHFLEEIKRFFESNYLWHKILFSISNSSFRGNENQFLNEKINWYQKEFGLFDKFKAMLIGWFLHDGNTALEEIKLILTKMYHELPNNLHDSAILPNSIRFRRKFPKLALAYDSSWIVTQ